LLGMILLEMILLQHCFLHLSFLTWAFQRAVSQGELMNISSLPTQPVFSNFLVVIYERKCTFLYAFLSPQNIMGDILVTQKAILLRNQNNSSGPFNILLLMNHKLDWLNIWYIDSMNLRMIICWIQSWPRYTTRWHHITPGLEELNWWTWDHNIWYVNLICMSLKAVWIWSHCNCRWLHQTSWWHQ
jgi:hypothetical protein